MTVRSFARLTVLLFLVGLIVSRVGVVVHELVGHYGVAHGFGCSLSELRLFLFGGGYVDYACPALTPAQQLAIDLGGIGVQAGLGVLLAALAGRRLASPLLRLVIASMAALFVLHGLFYLITGVHYGVGDGRALHLLLADRRGGLVAAGSAGLVALCWFAATRLARRLDPWLPRGEGAWQRLVLAGTAMLGAVALHGVAFSAEQRILANATYTESFRPQPAIEVERELRQFEVAEQPSPEQIAAQRRVLEAQHALFPLRPVLGAAMALAALAGLFVGLRREAVSLRSGSTGIARAAAICAVAEAIVVALDRLL